ncbi:hypothetical protein AOG28_17475 [Cobetia sp. UCD-24C]|nr:hypothetical protein AOG28_17475 [Cobetia sp. UCD-24C]
MATGVKDSIKTIGCYLTKLKRISELLQSCFIFKQAYSLIGLSCSLLTIRIDRRLASVGAS